MTGIHMVVVLGAVAVVYGLPLENSPARSNLVTGVFIPSDAFKNLQDRANANNQQPNQGTMQGAQPVVNVQNPQPTYQPVNTQTQFPSYQQPTVLTNQQPPQNQQPITINQKPVMTNQPSTDIQAMGSNIQPNQQHIIYAQQPLTADRDPNRSNQPIMVMANQPNRQPNQHIIFVQQPSNNQPIYVQQQPNQGGNQGYTVQPNQPTQVIIATNPPNGNQIQGTWVASPNQNHPGNNVYTIIPLNGHSNANSNSGSYVIPVQSGSSNPIVLSAGK